ncbi:unnamed protein product [Rotaria sp. Silwood2]|nr:unnamed protein product [Rotaria sp. Silwood2]CAF2587157.1 unnamed protein product [Rotaria sp. Silwood2]CAF4360895.1 unnamed protein product [Rotaria sp. Silwood2]
MANVNHNNGNNLFALHNNVGQPPLDGTPHNLQEMTNYLRRDPDAQAEDRVDHPTDETATSSRAVMVAGDGR